MSEQEIKQHYRYIKTELQNLTLDLESDLRNLIRVKNIENIDFIKYRVKEEKSFVDKALKINNERELLYPKPFFDIQDLIGIRIIVYYLSDVDRVFEILRNSLYRSIEITHHKPARVEDFKYEGKHYIVNIPLPLMKKYAIEGKIFPQVFELQILTLFQHAWATGEHDLTYKPEFSPTLDNKRYLAFVGAQSWGADRIFDEVYNQLLKKNGS